MADIKEVNGVFGGVEIGNINDQETTTNYAGGVEGIGANNLQSVGTNLPAKQGFWSKFKAFWLQPVDWKKEIKVELTPYQQKIEDELNDFIFDKLSWSNFKNFLFKNASFGKNKDEE